MSVMYFNLIFDYCHLLILAGSSGSYVSAGHHREYADRYCTGDQGEKTLEKLSVLNAPKATAIRVTGLRCNTAAKISYSMILLYLPQEIDLR